MAAFMDELVIDPISGEQISARHAVVLPIVKDISEVSEYVKSVGSSIGANNIRSAYKVEGRVKIYLRYARHVDELVSSGVRLRGHYATVEYSVLPATRVLLKNVETEIPNRVISSKLEAYGKVSRISTLKANIGDPEYSHVESNERQAFILANPGIDVPSKLEVFHDNRRYVIDVHVQKPERPVESSSPEPLTVPSSTSTGDDKEEVSQNVYEFPSESTSEKVVGRRYVVRGRGLGRRGYRGSRGGRGTFVKLSSSSRATLASMKNLKKIVKRGGRGRRSFRRGMTTRQTQENNVMPSTHGDDESSKVVDYMEVTQSRDFTSEHSRCSNNSNHSGPVITSVKSGVDSASLLMEPEVSFHEYPSDMCLINNSNNNSQNSTASLNGTSDSPYKLESSSKMCPDLTQYPFTYQMLDKFLRDVKKHRNPLEIALNMLEANETPGAINELCNQLIEYFNCCNDSSIRVRLSRLVFLISGGEKAL